jgi:hypothetical protein
MTVIGRWSFHAALFWDALRRFFLLRNSLLLRGRCSCIFCSFNDTASNWMYLASDNWVTVHWSWTNVNFTSTIITSIHILQVLFFIHVYMILFLFDNVIHVFLLLSLCILIVCLCLTILTEGFPCFFLSCKTNARVKPAKTGHGQHSS